ncbi:MAG: hypothetical protein ACXWPM_08545, partial [Bdellovibrionota bacterium]
KDWRARLAGPAFVRLDQPDDQVTIDYNPSVTFELVADEHQISTPLQLQLRVIGYENMSRLTDLELVTESKDFAWKHYQLRIASPLIDIDWHEGDGWAKIAAAHVNWSEGERAVNLTLFEMKLDSPVELHPFKIGPKIAFEWKGREAEILWGDTYLDLPLRLLPGKGELRMEPDPLTAKLHPTDAQAGIGVRENHVALHWTPENLEWKTGPLDLPATVTKILAATDPSWAPALREMQFLRGSAHATGKLGMRGRTRGQSEVKLEVQGLDWRWPEQKLAARGANLVFRKSESNAIEATLEARDLYFRHLVGHLAPTQIFMGKEDGGTLELHASSKDDGGIPLRLDGLDLKLGKLAGTFRTKPAPEGDENAGAYDLETSLDLSETPIEKLLAPFCITNRVPPIVLNLHLPMLEFYPGAIDPTGDLTAKVFEGTVRMNEMGLFNLDTPVHELDFNLDATDIRLDQLGEWSGFGAMDGFLNVYAHDVTVQSNLPTHYDFSFDIYPSQVESFWNKLWGKAKINFSPEAMRNLTHLFAGQALDRLPGLFDWIAFGLPQKIHGGYSIDYGGLSIFSDSGSMLLETHDPEPGSPDGKHYIFKGPHVFIPLISAHYPLVVDATSMAHFIYEARKTFALMAELKAEKLRGKPKKFRFPFKTVHQVPEEGDDNVAAPVCDPPEF